MNPRVFIASALLVVVFSGSGFADDASLRRCRAISDSAARLACYDAIAMPRAAAEPSAGALPESSRKEGSSALVERFGMEQRTSLQADRIESHIPGRFLGWNAKSLIKLANGQVWQVADDSWLAGVWDNPKVVIRRGMLSGFVLDIEGENRSPRVRRVQ